ncbi:MAG: UDP-N-acetylmuramoyl-tripeptide--D-alanyl-D-alanine ligase [Clostridia bacterium]|jgi:UDP-N-acetylmuramoyl-tripeptide--D-alanyl-D-alanine ligase|nr:UDP-N-acetylmuramoyl-tripeptide--D-alanyl-D-alanine ligase [Clostridia bacterium]
MKEIKVKDILEICNATLIFGDLEQPCENFTKDTRQIEQGDVYIGLKGNNFNGSMLYEEALKQGAKVCIIENNNKINPYIEEKYKGTSIIVVKNTLEALQKIAIYKRSLYKIPVVAITGSVGKTSTKDMIASVLEQKYKVLKTQGNYNNHIGLPLTILKLKNHEILVVEMGMSELGEIKVLTNIAKPTISVITNIGTSHIGNLGSRENILKAKLEILEGMDNKGILVINNDNDLLNEWNKQNKRYITKTFGINNKSNTTAENIEKGETSSKITLKIEQETISCKIPVGGTAFVYNAICAATVGKIMEIEKEKIITGIENFELTKNRMDIIKNTKDITIINDSYNANYESMKNAIENLATIKAKRKIAILGDMLELGEHSKNLHERVGEEIIKNKIDILICVGKESKYIIKKVEEQKMNINNIYYFSTNEEAIKKIKLLLKPEDAILIKASNGMKFSEIVKEISK